MKVIAHSYTIMNNEQANLYKAFRHDVLGLIDRWSGTAWDSEVKIIKQFVDNLEPFDAVPKPLPLKRSTAEDYTKWNPMELSSDKGEADLSEEYTPKRMPIRRSEAMKEETDAQEQFDWWPEEYTPKQIPIRRSGPLVEETSLPEPWELIPENYEDWYEQIKKIELNQAMPEFENVRFPSGYVLTLYSVYDPKWAKVYGEPPEGYRWNKELYFGMDSFRLVKEGWPTYDWGTDEQITTDHNEW